jgi:hypothetical protein
MILEIRILRFEAVESIERIIEGKVFSAVVVLIMIWLPSHPLPSPPHFRQQAWLATDRKTEKERLLADGRWREGGGQGAESCDRKKAWSSTEQII